MDRPISGNLVIERVDYDDAYGGFVEDLEFYGLGVAGEIERGGRGGGGGAAPTPNPTRKREGDQVALAAPHPLAGGAGGGPLPAEAGGGDARPEVDPAPSPQTFGPEPLLDLPLQALFCDHLAGHGNVRMACRAARVSPQTAYRMRRASAAFRRLWNAALVVARDQVEEVLADRAVNGWEEAVFYHGEEVATRRRYDSRLLLAHLGRLDKLADAADATLIDHFDTALAAMAAGEDPVLPPEGAPAQAGTSGVAPDGPRPQPSLGITEESADEDDGDEAVPLLEAQLRWLEARHGSMTEEEEIFHLLNTVPGVPGAELRRFGWRGGDGDLDGDLGVVGPKVGPKVSLKVSSTAARC